MIKPYRLAAVGGTFDHFHSGHANLLSTAFAAADQVIIGLTKPSLYQHKILFQQIESYAQRRNNLLKFISQHQYRLHTQIVPLSDPFGPALTNPRIDVLVVSEQTKAGADLLNRTRSARGLPPLPVKIARMITDDSGEHLSSTSIRLGLISPQGHTFIKSLNRGLILKPSQKTFFARPHGRIYTQVPENLVGKTLRSGLPVISVGDSIARACRSLYLKPTHVIYDALENRQPVSTKYLSAYPYPRISVNNPPGHITQSALNAVKQALRLPQCLIAVAGEEDLLAVPVLLLAPLGSLILYGQPQQGVVALRVTSIKKSEVVQILAKTQLDN